MTRAGDPTTMLRSSTSDVTLEPDDAIFDAPPQPARPPSEPPDPPGPIRLIANAQEISAEAPPTDQPLAQRESRHPEPLISFAHQDVVLGPGERLLKDFRQGMAQPNMDDRPGNEMQLGAGELDPPALVRIL
jgi:hypothetical protein